MCVCVEQQRLVIILSVPLVQVDFFGTYVADVMTSSVKTLLDLSWTIGYFVSGDFLLSRHKWKARPVEDVWEEYRWYKEILVPLLCLLPLWIRFQQCLRRFLDTGTRFPNLLNALKSVSLRAFFC